MRRRTHSLALLGDLAAELGEVGVDHLLGELRPPLLCLELGRLATCP